MPYISSELKTAFPETKDCKELQQQLNKLLVNQDYWSRQLNDSETTANKNFLTEKKNTFNRLNCDKTNILEKNAMVDFYFKKYSEIDKDRIEPESKLQAKKRIIVGASILVIGLGILFYTTKK